MCCFYLRYFGCLTTSVSHFEKELRYSNFCTLTVEGVGGAAVGPWRCLGSKEALATPPGTPSHSSKHNLVRQVLQCILFTRPSDYSCVHQVLGFSIVHSEPSFLYISVSRFRDHQIILVNIKS